MAVEMAAMPSAAPTSNGARLISAELRLALITRDIRSSCVCASSASRTKASSITMPKSRASCRICAMPSEPSRNRLSNGAPLRPKSCVASAVRSIGLSTLLTASAILSIAPSSPRPIRLSADKLSCSSATFAVPMPIDASAKFLPSFSMLLSSTDCSTPALSATARSSCSWSVVTPIRSAVLPMSSSVVTTFCNAPTSARADSAATKGPTARPSAANDALVALKFFCDFLAKLATRLSLRSIAFVNSLSRAARMMFSCSALIAIDLPY